MRVEDVPQDQFNFYNGHHRGVYAVDAKNRHVLASQSGWEIETYCTDLAWREVSRRIGAVLKDVDAGKKSPLAVHLQARMGSIAWLAKESGLSRWRVWLDLRPRYYKRMNEKRRQRYERTLTIPSGTLHDVSIYCDGQDKSL